MKEQDKEKLFEEIWDDYWWKKRKFGYRCSNSEERERDIIATAFESYLEKLNLNNKE